MDFSLAAIGCSLPLCFSRRKLALHYNINSPSKPQAPVDEEDTHLTALNASSWVNGSRRNKIELKHKDSFLVYLEQAASVLNLKGDSKHLDEEDDDTATTASFTSSSSSSSSSSSDSNRVSFAEPLVTAVHTRPYTSRADKYFLHYNEHDYADFKYDYLTGKGRNRKVSFVCEDATVHQLPPPNATKQDLFYSEQELQGFLDEFVQSLNHQF